MQRVRLLAPSLFALALLAPTGCASPRTVPTDANRIDANAVDSGISVIGDDAATADEPDAATDEPDAFTTPLDDAAMVDLDGGATMGCGNGVRESGEDCDDGNTRDADGCTATCTIEAGYSCDTAMPNRCTTACGDGSVGGGEACDDGNATGNDGCSSSCAVEIGFACSGAPSMCAPICGDMRVIPPTETCDDGNTTDGDGCDSNCTNSACGNGIRAGAERCDDGNRTSGDGCHADCLSEVEIEPNDDGSVRAGTSNVPNDLDAVARMSAVNNGVIRDAFVMRGSIVTLGDEDLYAFTNPATEPRWVTLTTTAGTCSLTSHDTVLVLVGPDGTYLQTNDDRATGNRCSLLRVEVPAGQTYYVAVLGFLDSTMIPSYDLGVAYCGDGAMGNGESCDDGNTVSGDGCDANCTITGCGNGIRTGSEECDDGNTVSGDGCEATCVRPTCGNGVLNGSETCDDGNTVSGDGCTARCTTEGGFTCTGTTCRSSYEYYCSGGNDDDGDGQIDCADADCDCALPITCAAGELLVSHRERGDLPANINDNATVSRSMNVPAGNVRLVATRMLIEHTYVGDLVLSLTVPGLGSAITLASRRGGSGDNYSNTTFADSCSTAITSGSAPFSGCYRPQAALSAANGARAAGVWAVNVNDASSGDVGLWRGFSVGICMTPD